MCGISGIIDRHNHPVVAADIERMTDLVAHRGPDGCGYYFGSNFALGHRRLAILDLSDAGKQPMCYGDKYVVIYNGEIYNYVELKDKLLRRNYRFTTRTDTEVLLAAYDCWGQDCVNHFNGMWAFALYDMVKNQLFCSRDRFGVKPFYFAERENRFLFGSEIKQLIEFFPSRKANRKVLLNYLVLGFEDYDRETFFENVFKLQPGHNLVYDLQSHGFEIARYYSIRVDESKAGLSEPEAVALYREELERSVRIRLRSDVKVGTCLSGGLDSSSIASLAAGFYHRESKARFSAITAKSVDRAFDESHYAALVVQRANLDWHIVEPDQSDFLNALDQVVRAQDEPFGSPSIVFQFFVMQKAREMNCPVLLDGQGGDETLLGYERYYPTFLRSQPVSRWPKAFFDSSRNSKLDNWQLLSYIFYFSNPAMRKQWLKKKNRFLKDEFLDMVDWKMLAAVSESYQSLISLQEMELSSVQLPHLLKYEDRNAMRHSIETRLPFIDYQLVELALSLNDSLKIKDGWTKHLLRRAVADLLPEEVTWRRNKIGFEPPLRLWLAKRDDFIGEIKQSPILAHLTKIDRLMPALGKVSLRTFWQLYNIARWEKMYNVQGWL
jgi:asparagine synthase (glutamine-hydrolysing)